MKNASLFFVLALVFCSTVVAEKPEKTWLLGVALGFGETKANAFDPSSIVSNSPVFGLSAELRQAWFGAEIRLSYSKQQSEAEISTREDAEDITAVQESETELMSAEVTVKVQPNFYLGRATYFRPKFGAGVSAQSFDSRSSGETKRAVGSGFTSLSSHSIRNDASVYGAHLVLGAEFTFGENLRFLAELRGGISPNGSSFYQTDDETEGSSYPGSNSSGCARFAVFLEVADGVSLGFEKQEIYFSHGQVSGSQSQYLGSINFGL